MHHRLFGRLGWRISVIGYGMWGMAGWTGSDDEQSLDALERAVEHGINFFDTAYAYGDGHSERLLSRILSAHRAKRLYAATKIPPKNRRWPALPEARLGEVFPGDHVREYAERSATNLGVGCIDLLQFHVWNDAWAQDERWQRVVEDLKREGLIRGFGISVNRWEPTNVLAALETGLVDAVQVVYNVFDQNPEDELFPACERLKIGVIARVPFDEGSLTGTLTKDSRWPDGDWRNIYFTPQRLAESIERVERLQPLVPTNGDLPELALRFIVQHPAVSTTIPGMRRARHVEANVSAGAMEPLDPRTYQALKAHRWERGATRES